MHSIYPLMIIFSPIFASVFGECNIGTTNLTDFALDIANGFEQIGESYYLIDAVNTTDWFAAAQLCRGHGANLASIDSQAELDSLTRTLRERPYGKGGDRTDRYWLSGNDLEENDEYIWLGTGKPVPMDKYWAKGAPYAPRGADCIEILNQYGRYELTNAPCWKISGLICEVSETMLRRQRLAQFISKTVKIYADLEE